MESVGEAFYGLLAKKWYDIGGQDTNVQEQ